MKRYYGVLVGVMVGLLVEGSLEEAVGDGGLAGSSVLTSPEAAELGSLNCVAGRWELEEVGTRKDCYRERGGES